MPKIKPKDAASASYLKGKQYHKAGKFDEAYVELEKALRFYKHSSEKVLLADILRRIGEILFSKGNLIESRNHYKRAYIAFSNFGNKIGMADCYDQVAMSFMLQDEYHHAEDYQLKALKLRKSTGDKKGLARGLKNLAVIVYTKDQDHEKALKYLAEAIELAMKCKDPHLMINIALDQFKIQNKLGLFEEAMKSFVIARRFSKKYSVTLPDDHETDFADLLLNLGLQKYDEGDLEDALKYLKNAALIFKSRNDPMFESVEPTITKLEQLLTNKSSATK